MRYSFRFLGVLSLLFLFPLHSLSQDTTINKDFTYYLEKSKRQRTAGWVMFGVGVGLIIAGSAIISSDFSETEGGGGMLFTVGAASTLISIPILISAGINKKKGQNLRAGLTLLRSEFGRVNPNSPHSIGITISMAL